MAFGKGKGVTKDHKVMLISEKYVQDCKNGHDDGVLWEKSYE
jgi:hypothetical protein